MPKDALEIDDVQTPEVAALKSGLPVFYGRVLAALESIAESLRPQNPEHGSVTAVKDPSTKTRRSDA